MLHSVRLQVCMKNSFLRVQLHATCQLFVMVSKLYKAQKIKNLIDLKCDLRTFHFIDIFVIVQKNILYIFQTFLNLKK